MKKNGTNNILVALMVIVVVACGSFSTYADCRGTGEVCICYSDKEVKVIRKAQDRLTGELRKKKLSALSEKKQNQVIRAAVKTYYQEPSRLIEKKIQNQKGKNSNAVLRSNLKGRCFTIDSGMKIVFFDTGFYITIEEEGAARTPKRRVGTMRATSFVAKNPYGRAIILKQKKKPKDEKEKTASAKACFYDSWTGRKCFQVYVKARFTYNKKKKTCTMETLSHYAKKYHIETLLSQVHDVEYTENKDSKKKRSAVQSGYIRTGITIKGVGIVLSDHFASAFVGCDYRGKITKCSVTD